MKKVETTNAFVTGLFPNTLAIDSTGAATQDGFEFIAAYLNNMVVGPQQAMMDYAAGNSNPDVGGVGVPNGVTEAAGFSQLLEATHKAFGIGPGVYKPYGKFLDPSVTGDRILLLSNQGVLISAFPELVAACYVGDGNNATAPFFYKSVLADGATRNVAGPFFILPNGNPTYQRQYLGDTAGSLDFTVSGQATFAVTRAVAVPYVTSDGTPRMIFNIRYTSGVVAAQNITFSGVTFKNVASFFQSVNFAVVSTTIGDNKFAYTQPGTGIVRIEAGNALSSGGLSGDVELESLPTWADDFSFPLGITY